MWRKKERSTRREESREGLTAKIYLNRATTKLARVLATPWRVFSWICFSIGFLFVTSLLCAYLYAASFLRSLPPVERMQFADLQALAQRRIVDRAVDKRLRHPWVSLREVSRDYLYSIVLSEDGTFFEHGGLNLDAVADALAENIRERRTAFGGSTISQQVTKNLFLSNEKTLLRKVKELLLTRSLERRFSKNEILEIYFNIADFGPDIFGVSDAAWRFFHKRPIEVNAAEGAFIALMLPSPKRHYYTIYENRNLTRQKRKKIERVLRDMLYEEYITDADFRRYMRFDYFTTAPAPRLPARSRRE